jgi:replicative DNA helicase
MVQLRNGERLEWRVMPLPRETGENAAPVEGKRESAEGKRPRFPQPADWTAAIDGAAFALDAPVKVPALWGEGESVAWASGEPLCIVGPQGVGKTTLANQLVLSRMGLAERALNLPVAQGSGKVLLLALDRPAQLARALRRLVGEDQREVLAERLVVWRHRLPFELAREPNALATMAADLGADTVVLDAAKDTGLRLTEDAGGAALNDALQAVVEAGAEVVFTHHQRKATAENRKPKTLADVYGSTWITAGCGSVLLLWGEPGDAVVDLSHLKQPADEIGPLTVTHDHRRGTTRVEADDRPVLLDVIRERGTVTAREAAAALFGTPEPERNQVAKARRRLEKLADDGALHRDERRSANSPPVAMYSEAK